MAAAKLRAFSSTAPCQRKRCKACWSASRNSLPPPSRRAARQTSKLFYFSKLSRAPRRLQTSKKPGRVPGFLQMRKKRRVLALAGFHARVLLVDHVHPAMAADDAAILVAGFRGFQGVTDLHNSSRQKWIKSSGAICRCCAALSTVSRRKPPRRLLGRAA